MTSPPIPTGRQSTEGPARPGPLAPPSLAEEMPSGHQHWTKRDLTPACWRTISKTTGKRFTSWHGHGWIVSTPPSVPASQDRQQAPQCDLRRHRAHRGNEQFRSASTQPDAAGLT